MRTPVVANGSCLCGKVAFILYVRPQKYYRCHCSLCRKQSGTGHNMATVVPSRDFDWAHGTENIATWQRPQGYRNDFCVNCGSTVPNLLRETPYVWVPVGLIENRFNMTCAGDFCTNDAMPWDVVDPDVAYCGAPEALGQLISLLGTR